MKVGDWMASAVHTCRVDENLNDVAGHFWANDRGWLPVVDSREQLVGTITDRDVCIGAHFRGSPLTEIPVSETMSRNPKTVKPGEDLLTTAALMASTRVRRLPVVDESGRLVGAIGVADLARAAGAAKSDKERHALADELARTLNAITGAPMVGGAAPSKVLEPKKRPAVEKKKAPAKKKVAASGTKKSSARGRGKKA